MDSGALPKQIVPTFIVSSCEEQAACPRRVDVLYL